MSTLLRIDDIVECRVNSTDGVSKLFNILHYRVFNINETGGGGPPDYVDGSVYLPLLAQSLYTNIFGDWSAASSAQMTLESVTAQSPYPEPRSRPYTYVPAMGETGLIAGDMLPTQDAVTLLKRTAFGERWGLGRYFHSGIPESSQDKGTITDAYAALVQSYGDTLGLAVQAVNGTLVVTMIPVLFALTGDPPQERSTIVSSFDLSDKVIKTQRRRRPGKGI